MIGNSHRGNLLTGLMPRLNRGVSLTLFLSIFFNIILTVSAAQATHLSARDGTLAPGQGGMFYLCSAYGPKSVTLDENGEPVDRDAAGTVLCVFCLPFNKTGLVLPELSGPLDTQLAVAVFPRPASDSLRLEASPGHLPPARAPPLYFL